MKVLLVALLLGSIYPPALAQVALPGALLHLDASGQNNRDKSWRNLGLIGGKLPPNNATPDLRDGTIKIPEAGFKRKLKWYTVGARSEGFAGKPDITPPIKLKDWTAEFLVKRNGPKWPDLVVATQFAGFHSRKRATQGLRILMNGPDTGEVVIWIKGGNTEKGNWFGAAKVGIDIEKKTWHWIALVFTNRQKLETYQDGKKVGTMQTTQHFNGEEPLWPTIFSAWESDRTFNGAFAIIRIYDRALNEKEINQNITGDLAIQPANKLSMMWARVKREASP